CRRNAPRRTAAVPTTESPAPPGSESTPRPPRRSPRRSPPPPPAGHDLQTSLQVLRFTNDKGPVGSAAGPVSDRGYLSGIRLQNRLITGPITGSQVKCTIFRSLASINRLTANSRLRCYGRACGGGPSRGIRLRFAREVVGGLARSRVRTPDRSRRAY